MFTRHNSLIAIILFVITLLSLWLYPTATPVLGLTSLLLSLAIAIHAIFERHKETKHARPKILKEVGVMVLTLIAILFLGGIAGVLANAQVSIRWGEVAGFISAIAVSFGVGYLVRKGMGRVVKVTE